MDLILAIDDDIHALKLLEIQLSGAGFNVTTTVSGKAGIEMAKTGSPALIILDMMMPGVDGIGVLHALQQETVTSRIPIIMLSAQSERSAVISAMRLGVSDYMIKPYDIAVLMKKVRSAINYSRMQRYAEEGSDVNAIHVLRGSGRTVIAFTAHLRHPKIADEIKRIFSRTLLTMSARDNLVFDLRGLETLTKDDIPVLKTMRSLFPGKTVHIIAGRHYGEIIEDPSFGDDASVQLYISPGDMELELELNSR